MYPVCPVFFQGVKRGTKNPQFRPPILLVKYNNILSYNSRKPRTKRFAKRFFGGKTARQ
jgi:hypothetical protein